MVLDTCEERSKIIPMNKIIYERFSLWRLTPPFIVASLSSLL